MQTQDMLREIGLTDSETKVYLTLLDIGDSTRHNIVHKSGIAGSKVYDVLQKLQDKGLVSSYVKDKVKHFKAVNPSQILNYLEHKKEDIALLEKDALSILPSLMARFTSSSQDQEVELLTGLKGMEILFREQVEVMSGGETCYVIGGTRGSAEEGIVAFFKKIHLMREKKKINTKMLYNIRQKAQATKDYSKKEYPHTQTRYIGHTSPVAINIYKDRTVIILFAKSITAIHIRSHDVADSFKEYFDILWKQSKA